MAVRGHLWWRNFNTTLPCVPPWQNWSTWWRCLYIDKRLKFYRYRYGRETGGIEKKKKTKEVNNRPRERKKEEEETEDKEKEKEGEEVKLRRGTQRPQRQQTSQSGRSAPSPIEHRASLLLHHATTKSSTSPAQEQPYGCSCPSVGRLACRTASCRILSLAGPCHRLPRRRAVWKRPARSHAPAAHTPGLWPVHGVDT